MAGIEDDGGPVDSVVDRVLKARIEALESGDPWQGVRVTAVAKTQPYRADQPSWGLPIEFKAHCDVCEWAASLLELPGDFTLGLQSNEFLRVSTWPVYHVTTPSHALAWARWLRMYPHR